MNNRPNVAVAVETIQVDGQQQLMLGLADLGERQKLMMEETHPKVLFHFLIQRVSLILIDSNIWNLNTGLVLNSNGKRVPGC